MTDKKKQPKDEHRKGTEGTPVSPPSLVAADSSEESDYSSDEDQENTHKANMYVTPQKFKQTCASEMLGMLRHYDGDGDDSDPESEDDFDPDPNIYETPINQGIVVTTPQAPNRNARRGHMLHAWDDVQVNLLNRFNMASPPQLVAASPISPEIVRGAGFRFNPDNEPRRLDFDSGDESDADAPRKRLRRG